MVLSRALLVSLVLAAAGCTSQPPGADPVSATGTATAAAPTASGAHGGPGPAASAAGSGDAAPAAAPSASAEAPASAAPPAEAPVVDVKNIGMHIGGGPNDAETKAPIKRSVDPHMAAFAACFAKADPDARAGDVSVDLKIEAKGGKAELKKYKSGISGADFEPCVRGVFAAIDFEKPKTGATVVSYSLRFSPKKK